MVASFGERLKQEREKKGMTLEDVSGATKISVRNLRALEQEKFELMPGGIFNRGFVRAYAKHLGLNDDQVVADYMEAAGEAAPAAEAPSPPEALAEPENESQESTGQVPWAALVGLLILGTVLLAVWSYRSHRKGPEGAIEAPGATSGASAAPSGAPLTSYASSSPASESQVSVNAPVAAAGNSLPVRNVPVQNSPSASSNGSRKVGFDLSLRALDEVWLSTAVDGKPPSEMTMEDGQSLTVHAAERAILRVGNAGALQVAFNGQKVPVHGGDGDVRTLTFTEAGLQPPAPAAAKSN